MSTWAEVWTVTGLTQTADSRDNKQNYHRAIIDWNQEAKEWSNLWFWKDRFRDNRWENSGYIRIQDWLKHQSYRVIILGWLVD